MLNFSYIFDIRWILNGTSDRVGNSMSLIVVVNNNKSCRKVKKIISM